MKLLIMLWMVLTTQQQPSTGETEHHLSSIFLTGTYTSYCQLECSGTTRHTLCELPSEPTRTPAQCEKFQQLLGSPHLWENILNAHNGIRDRYAMRRHITNMKKLVWDDELARMARLHLATCQRYRHDPCTELHQPNVYSRDYRNVRQSKAFVIERYLPKYYAFDVLRSWYLQKDETPSAQVTVAHQLQQTVLNNFTLLTWASLERVGCAAAKYHDGFQLVCNYFPYYSLAEPSAELGPPATRCPRTFPLRSKIFDGLCTFEMDGGMSWKLANLAMVPLGVLCLLRTREAIVSW